MFSGRAIMLNWKLFAREPRLYADSIDMRSAC